MRILPCYPKMKLVSIIIFAFIFISSISGNYAFSAPNINEQQALEIAKKTLKDSYNPKYVLVITNVKEFPFGWAYEFRLKEYLETKDDIYLIPGLGPLIVNRDGTSVQLGTSPFVNTLPPLETYYNNWKKEHPGAK